MPFAEHQPVEAGGGRDRRRSQLAPEARQATALLEQQVRHPEQRFAEEGAANAAGDLVALVRMAELVDVERVAVGAPRAAQVAADRRAGDPVVVAAGAEVAVGAVDEELEADDLGGRKRVVRLDVLCRCRGCRWRRRRRAVLRRRRAGAEREGDEEAAAAARQRTPNSSRSSSVSSSDTTIELKQPSRFEKKKNTVPGCHAGSRSSSLGAWAAEAQAPSLAPRATATPRRARPTCRRAGS